MTVYCLGSINIDHVYRLPHLPRAGETLAAIGYLRALGGKGANQSVAVLRAGARVVHMGAVGADDGWTLGQMAGLGLDVGSVLRLPVPTGQAVVATDPGGENQIVILSSANRALPVPVLDPLKGAVPGDTLLLQNETNLQPVAAARARAAGLRVMYSAAPYDTAALLAVLPHATHLLMNAGEAEALVAATGTALGALPVEAVIVTRGAQGADWVAAGRTIHVPALPVTPVDTTGAGDCFAGSLAARLDLGDAPQDALAYAAAAAAIQVTRPGAAPAMPTEDEVRALLG